MTRQYFENLIMIHDDIWITDGTNTYWLKWDIKGLPGEDKIHISLQHTWGEKPNPVFAFGSVSELLNSFKIDEIPIGEQTRRFRVDYIGV